jgi:hypothetical protein
MSGTPPKHYGLAGVGSAGHFDVEIDEALDDPNDVQMNISTPGWSFRFNVSARSDVPRMLSFLREQTGSLVFSELAIGSFSGGPVLLIKDSEFADRFWLRATGTGQMIEFVLAGRDLADFTEAVTKAVEDLES